MPEDRDIQDLMGEEKRTEPSGKYRLLLQDKKTEKETRRTLEYGTEVEPRSFLGPCGVRDESPRLSAIAKPFRE
jgi:hypothetical protein